MSVCGKCTLDIDAVAGYAKCVGCNKRFHYGICSVSSTTWRAKSQQLKDEWRCESCRKAPPLIPNNEDSLLGDFTVITPGDVTIKAVLDAVHQLGRQQDEKTNLLKQSLKSHTTALTSKVEKLIQGLSTKLQDVIKVVNDLSSAQSILVDENAKLKTELQQARDHIGQLELKRQNSAVVTQSRDSSHGESQSTSTADRARLTRPYSSVVVGDPGNGSAHSNSMGTTAVQSPSAGSSGVPFPQRNRRGTSGGQVASNAVSQVNVGQGGHSEEWNQVTRKRGIGNTNASGVRKKAAVPKFGTRTSDAGSSQSIPSLPIVKARAPRERRSALFVSRFAPDVASCDIENMIRGSVTLSSLKVSKIKTRHNEYSSFHVEVLSVDLNKVDDVNIWPDGCLIKPYYGALIADVIVNESLPPAETWFNDGCRNCNYFTDEYFIFRKDRICPIPKEDVRGGGTLIAVKKTFKVHRRFDLDFNNVECTWVEIDLGNNNSNLI
ncbi:hypothetical protein WDU94_009853, partial [Cyamophila willieti]